MADAMIDAVSYTGGILIMTMGEPFAHGHDTTF
jgi:hypothetical protein